MTTGNDWADARRVESWAAEVRVNLLRLAALLAFYVRHLVFYLFQDDSSDQGAYHARVTVLAVTWAAAAAVLHYFLARRLITPAVKYVSASWDVLLTTALLAITFEGPRSPLTILYLLIIASTTLRLSLPLVYATTLASVAGYLVVLGHFVFFVIGAEAYYANPQLSEMRRYEFILVLGMGTMGLLAGQSVRQARRLVRGYAVAVSEPEEQP
jgi:nitrate reductase gamma subunit